MNDLIDRQAAIKAVSEYGCIWMEYTRGMTKDEIAQRALNNAKATMIRIVKELPSAQQMRKKGRWLNINESEKWECSECGRMMWFSPRLDVKLSDYSFCPNCGADMEGDLNG